MLKVALCYSGAVRGLIRNLPQIKKVFFHEDIFDIDYYFYGDPSGASIREDDIEKGLKDPQGLRIKNELPQFNCLFENERGPEFNKMLLKFKSLIFKYNHPIEQQVLQWHGVKRVFEFAFSHDKQYDLYFRIRPDIFPAGQVKFDWHAFDENTVYAPFMGNFGGLNDRFAFGSKKAMEVYSKFYDTDIYYRGPSEEVSEKSKKYFEKIYQNVPVDKMHPNISDKLKRDKWREEHKSAYKYGISGCNSEFRLFNHIISNDVDIKLINPEFAHIGAVRNDDGFIRYYGPEFEGLLIKYNQIKPEEIKYDGGIWWD